MITIKDFTERTKDAINERKMSRVSVVSSEHDDNTVGIEVISRFGRLCAFFDIGQPEDSCWTVIYARELDKDPKYGSLCDLDLDTEINKFLDTLQEASNAEPASG